MDQSMEEYLLQMINERYIKEDGTPLKCFCGSTDLEQVGEYYDEHTLVEYEVKCKTCGRSVGYWAYGNWKI